MKGSRILLNLRMNDEEIAIQTLTYLHGIENGIDMIEAPQVKRQFLNNDVCGKLFWVVAAVAVISPFALYITAYRRSKTTIEFTIDHREQVTAGNGESSHSQYLIWTPSNVVCPCGHLGVHRITFKCKSYRVAPATMAFRITSKSLALPAVLQT